MDPHVYVFAHVRDIEGATVAPSRYVGALPLAAWQGDGWRKPWLAARRPALNVPDGGRVTYRRIDEGAPWPEGD